MYVYVYLGLAVEHWPIVGTFGRHNHSKLYHSCHLGSLLKLLPLTIPTSILVQKLMHSFKKPPKSAIVRLVTDNSSIVLLNKRNQYLDEACVLLNTSKWYLYRQARTWRVFTKVSHTCVYNWAHLISGLWFHGLDGNLRCSFFNSTAKQVSSMVTSSKQSCVQHIGGGLQLGSAWQHLIAKHVIG